MEDVRHLHGTAFQSLGHVLMMLIIGTNQITKLPNLVAIFYLKLIRRWPSDEPRAGLVVVRMHAHR